jgi:hypothetical protein
MSKIQGLYRDTVPLKIHIILVENLEWVSTGAETIHFSERGTKFTPPPPTPPPPPPPGGRLAKSSNGKVFVTSFHGLLGQQKWSSPLNHGEDIYDNKLLLLWKKYFCFNTENIYYMCRAVF